MTAGGIRYGTSTVIVWPRMSSRALVACAPAVVPPVTASTARTVIAAIAAKRRCNLFILPPRTRLCELVAGAAGVGPARSTIVGGDTTRALEGIQRNGHGVHPLDPLTATEVAAVSSIVRAHAEFAALSERTRFISISLREPLKADVLAWAAGGDAPPREAEVVILDQGAQATVEALVALGPAGRDLLACGGPTSSRWRSSRS